MRITVIHNPGAGRGDPDAKALRRLIRDAGYKLRYHSSKEKGLRAVLKKRAAFVVVAGGDGIVARVARNLAGKDTPIAILPLGTANNIAHSLGIEDVEIGKLVKSWKKAKRIPFDSGRARGPWGKRRFIEGMGVGLFAWTIPQADDSKKLSEIDKPTSAVDHVLKMLEERVERYQPHALEAHLDGRDLSGRYVMFEAMNLQYVGPNLHLAPGVEPGDGYLHVVAVREAEREKLRKYLALWRKGKAPRVKLPTFRGKHLRIERGDYHVHVDDRIWENGRQPKRARTIDVKIEPRTLEFMVP